MLDGSRDNTKKGIVDVFAFGLLGVSINIVSSAIRSDSVPHTYKTAEQW